MKTQANDDSRTLAHTYDRAYRLVALDGTFDGPTSDLTFYEAVKALKAAHSQGLCQDATHIRRGTRMVAFFCEWNKAPRAAFAAMDDEREQV